MQTTTPQDDIETVVTTALKCYRFQQTERSVMVRSVMVSRRVIVLHHIRLPVDGGSCVDRALKSPSDSSAFPIWGGRMVNSPAPGDTRMEWSEMRGESAEGSEGDLSARSFMLWEDKHSTVDPGNPGICTACLRPLAPQPPQPATSRQVSPFHRKSYKHLRRCVCCPNGRTNWTISSTWVSQQLSGAWCHHAAPNAAAAAARIRCLRDHQLIATVQPLFSGFALLREMRR